MHTPRPSIGPSTSEFTFSEILRAYEKARKSRKNKYETYVFNQNREERLIRMLAQINSGTYEHGAYRELVLNDSKKRYIASPKFADHVFHHLVYARLYPALDPKMVHTSFACRVGYGSHKAVKSLHSIIGIAMKRYGENAYYCKLDFSKYFFTIPHAPLKSKIGKFVRNESLLRCIHTIVDSYSTGYRYDDVLGGYPFYLEEPGKGIPIGSILSQLFANFYLNDLDQYVKHGLKLRFVRYMDDIVLVGEKSEILASVPKIRDFCLREKLILRPDKTKVHPVRDGVKFVGYDIRDSRIFVGKRIRSGYQKFMDRMETSGILDGQSSLFSENDILRLRSMQASRVGHFALSPSGSAYLAMRGSIEFIRGGNANNGTNAGIFTLNLN